MNKQMNEPTDRPIPEIPEIPVTDDEDVAADAPVASSGEPTADDEERKRLIEEAEQRGYMRGRNEMISRMMSGPQLFADLARLSAEQSPQAPSDDPAELFLTRLRPRIWD